MSEAVALDTSEDADSDGNASDVTVRTTSGSDAMTTCWTSGNSGGDGTAAAPGGTEKDSYGMRLCVTIKKKN